jgi:CRP-like cAMP-binding protein
MHHVVELARHISPISTEAAETFDAIVRGRTVKKGTKLVRIGHRVPDFYFVVRGLARVYYQRNGDDVTDYFAFDGQFIGAIPALFNGMPSHKAVETLEETTIESFAYAAIEDLCARYHDLERFIRRLAVFAFLDVQERIEQMRFMSVRERYEDLERRHPGISNRVSLRHIASYVGTTNVSISRIRAGKQ